MNKQSPKDLLIIYGIQDLRVSVITNFGVQQIQELTERAVFYIKTNNVMIVIRAMKNLRYWNRTMLFPFPPTPSKTY